MNEINDLVFSMLERTADINTFFDYEGDVFGNKPSEELRYSRRQDHFELRLGCTRSDSGFKLEILNWHSQSMCLTGLHFASNIVVLDANFTSDGLEYPAFIKDGIGERYLFRALGACRISIKLEVYLRDVHLLVDEEGMTLPVYFSSLSADLSYKTNIEKQEVYNALIHEDSRFSKQLLISEVKNNYENFRPLSQLDPSEFNKPYLPNQKFKELFDEQ